MIVKDSQDHMVFLGYFYRYALSLCLCAASVGIGLGDYSLSLTVGVSYLSAMIALVCSCLLADFMGQCHSTAPGPGFLESCSVSAARRMGRVLLQL